MSSLYILDINPLSDVELVKSISHSVDCYFVPMMVAFVMQKLFSFLRSHLLIVDLSACANGVLLRKFFSMPMSSQLFSTFSSMRFSVSAFMLRYLITLELIFMRNDKCRPVWILLHAATQFCQHHLLKMCPGSKMSLSITEFWKLLAMQLFTCLLR